MDLPQQKAGRTRRRRGRGTRSQKGGDVEGEEGIGVEKVSVPSVPATQPAAPTTQPVVGVQQTAGAAPKVVLSPAKKKPAKVMLVPRSHSAAASASGHRLSNKTFKAKRFRLTIDNSAKTVKRRRQLLGRVDAMTDDQIRDAAVQAKLTRRESVARAPVPLLRQMIRDYQTMKGMLL